LRKTVGDSLTHGGSVPCGFAAGTSAASRVLHDLAFTIGVDLTVLRRSGGALGAGR
jgi:hypothetical protein